MLSLSPALIISIDRLLSGTIDHVAWVKTFVIIVIASFCVSLGFSLQNLSQKNNYLLPIQKQRSAPYQTLNLIGIALVVTQFVLELTSLVFNDQSLLAWIGFTTLAFNVILSSFINNEDSSPMDWLIAGTMMAGISISISSGLDTFRLLTSVQIIDLLHTNTFRIFIIAASFWTFTLLYLTMTFDPAHALVGIMSSLSRSQRNVLHRLCLCALAGSLAGLAMTSTRIAVSLTTLSRDDVNQLSRTGSSIIIISAISLILAYLATMNHAVGLYDNLYAIPMKSVFESVIGIGGSTILYNDSITYSRIVLLTFGILLCCSGFLIMLLASDRVQPLNGAYLGLDEESVHEHEKQSLLRDSLQA